MPAMYPQFHSALKVAALLKLSRPYLLPAKVYSITSSGYNLVDTISFDAPIESACRFYSQAINDTNNPYYCLGMFVSIPRSATEYGLINGNNSNGALYANISDGQLKLYSRNSYFTGATSFSAEQTLLFIVFSTPELTITKYT